MSRKRKHKKQSIAAPERKASGNYKQPTDDARRHGMWNRLKHGEKIAKDPIWQTRYGELLFNGKITPIQAEAAERWENLLSYDDKLNGYRRSPSPIALEKTDRGRQAPEDPEKVATHQKRFAAAHGALCNAGMIAEAAVTKMCRGEFVVVDNSILVAIRGGLDALVQHYGLDRLEKSL